MAGGACVDDDECANNSNGCHEGRSVCTNDVKTYTMERVRGDAQYTMSGCGLSCACNVGYSDDNLDGTVCFDVDECLDDNEDICAMLLLTASLPTVVTGAQGSILGR